jgi:hypothetical protein
MIIEILLVGAVVVVVVARSLNYSLTLQNIN